MNKPDSIIIPEMITHEYKGCSFVQKKSDGYVNLTDMVKLSNKSLADWKRLNMTRDYINEISVSMGIPVDRVMYYHGDGCKKVTWGHPMLALHLAKWISPAFHVWCNQHLLELMSKGEVKLTFSPNITKVNKKKIKRLPSEYIYYLNEMKDMLDEDVDLAIHLFYSFAEKLANS